MWTSRLGLKAKRKPSERIAVSLTTSSALTKPLNAVDSRTPMMLSTHRPTMSPTTTIKCGQACVDALTTRQQFAQVVDAAPGEERDIDREIEQHRPAGDEAEDIAEPAQ